MRENLVTQPELLDDGRQCEERPRVAHREPPAAQVGLDLLREAQEAQGVGDRRAVLADPLGQLLLSPPELGEELLVGLRGLDRVEVLAQQVLNEGQLDALRVGRVANDRRNPIEARLLGGAPAPLAGNELIRPGSSADDDRLDDAGRLDRRGQFV